MAMLTTSTKSLLCALAAVAGGYLLGPRQAAAQDFAVQTGVAATGDQYSYTFTLNYDQSGATPALTDNIWQWSFFLEPNTPQPTSIVSPSGWQASYDPPTGEFDWFTEGPNGYASGDFGPNTIAPGASLDGFGLTTPLAPDTSIAFAYDEQFNQDANAATLPVTLAAAPEPSGTTPIVAGVLMLTGLLVWKNRRSGHSRSSG